MALCGSTVTVNLSARSMEVQVPGDPNGNTCHGVENRSSLAQNVKTIVSMAKSWQVAIERGKKRESFDRAVFTKITMNVSKTLGALGRKKVRR